MGPALTEVFDPDHVRHPPGEPWWLAASELKDAIEQQPPSPRMSAHYRFGDGVLRIESHTSRLLDMFEQLYGDCAISAPVTPEQPLVRCIVRRGGHPPFLLLTFLDGAPHDPASAFLPMRETRVWNSPLPGWRLAAVGTRTILAACGTHVLINLQQAWERLPIEYLVNATLAAQPELVAIHAASLRMRSAGLLLAGPSGSGKTTTALHLAARGLTLLGDEVALIRTATTEIVPFRRTANLRPGPRAPELSVAIEQLPCGEPPLNEEGAASVRISDLFPGSDARAARLSAAFFLRGFADQSSLTPFRPTLNDLDAFNALAGNEIATLWGLPRERRALRLMAVRHLFDQLPCWLLDAGAPGQTAALIERTMEDHQCLP